MTISTAQSALQWVRAAKQDEYRWEEVRPIILCWYGKTCRSNHCDPEDFIQDVCATMLRQRSTNPWDSTRMGWRGFVLLIARSTWSHWLEKKLLRVEEVQVEQKDLNEIAAPTLPPTVLLQGEALRQQAAQELQCNLPKRSHHKKKPKPASIPATPTKVMVDPPPPSPAQTKRPPTHPQRPIPLPRRGSTVTNAPLASAPVVS